MKYRIEPGVIAQSLRLSFSHLPQYVMPPGRLVLGARFSRVLFTVTMDAALHALKTKGFIRVYACSFVARSFFKAF